MTFNQVENNGNKFLDQNLDFFNEIFSIISHEVNNPVSSIKLASDLIKERYVNVDPELLEIIKSEALRITRLFNNFNLTDSQTLSKKTQENIHELIRLSLFKIKQMPNKLKIIEEFDPSLPMIRINRDLIIQALDNLLINAYESSNFSANSFLKVQTRFIVGESIKIPNLKNYIKKNSLSINISENGVGIKKDFLEKIFLPFFSTKKRGSGIGLFIVKKIIDDHEGSIDIESSGGITSLKIILPF
jgi:two-component system nitrogen regulation sensor histidine kinase GlnL